MRAPVQAPVRAPVTALQGVVPRTAPVPAAPQPVPRTRRPAISAEPSWGKPRRPQTGRGRSRDEVGWVKAHGGAGVTSLVEVFGGVDIGARWPDPSRGEPRRVVLVGRTSARGLRSVSQALGLLNDGIAPRGSNCSPWSSSPTPPAACR